MASYIDPSFRESLLKSAQNRTAQDLTLINANLKSLEALSSLRDTTIRNLCKSVRYEKHESNDVLYRTDDAINCWYILLSGSVFIDGSMFLPRSGFGRRTASQSIRMHDCLVLETSEMIVIDYPTIKKDTAQFNSAQTPKQITIQQDTQYQEIGQIPTKLKSGSKSNNNIDRLLQPSKTSRTHKTESSCLIANKQSNFDDYNSDNSCFQPNKHTNVGQDIKGQRICPILSGNSSLSSISSSFGNTNNSLNQNNNFTTFKNLTSVSSNPAISLNDEPAVSPKQNDSAFKSNKNDQHRLEIHSNSSDTKKESSIMPSSQTSNEKLNNDGDYLDDDVDNKNVPLPAFNTSNYVISQNSTSGSHFIEEYNSQIKSICIITGNPSFKANVKQNHNQRNNYNRNATQKITTITDASDQHDLDLSQQTINSNSNANHSVNTIDTLDIDDLHDLNNENNLNSSVNKSLSRANSKHSEIHHHHKSNSINSLNSIKMNHIPTATTISISESIGDDGSATSEQSIQMSKDLVREVLEKDPKERSDEDIDVLFEFMQSFPAFSELSQSIIRKLCACMVLGVVDKADTLVLDHNEKLDSWAVVLNGHVECILPDSSIKSYQIGDHFGVDATLEPVYHEGIMRTRCEDCQFVLVKQNDYYEILNKSKENLNNHTENGKLVLITEQRVLNNTTDKTGEIVLRGSLEKLVERLICEDSYSIVDPTYIQDFLLTYRVFIEDPIYISNKLFEWFQLNKIPSYLTHNSPNVINRNNNQTNQCIVKKKVYRIVLEWITNHFNDFETNKSLYEFVERFQEILNKEKMVEQFRVLTIAISTKSKVRLVTLARSKRDEPLMFNIQGGWDKGYGIFVSRVEKDSKAFEIGIRKGDQLLEVNGHSFQHILHANAIEMIKSFTHLSIKLKYNPIGFNEMLLHPDKSPHRNKKNAQNNNKAYLIEYLQMQQNQFQNPENSETETKDNISTNSVNNDTQPVANSILDHLQSSNLDSSTGSQAKKTIGSIPPLPPASANQTPKNKAKDKEKANFRSSSNTISSQSNSNHIRKILGRFNPNRKAHSKDLESLQPIDSSAPSLTSITRSPSPSLSNTFNSNNSNTAFNRSYTTTSINSITGSLCNSTSTSEYSPNSREANTLRANASSSFSNLNVSNEHDFNKMSTSLASINLQEQQQFAGEHVLKIYKNDQNFKYLVVHKETSVKEVVMLSLTGFSINDDIGSTAYSLCEVSVDQDRLIKQKRLPDQLNNLSEKLPLNARYYLKSNVSPENFLNDPMAVEELIKDANLNFLQLDPLELAAQLTLRDYCIFKSIESSEYVDYLFKKNSKFGFQHLNQFSDLSNEEIFWVVHEILHESNLVKRAKIIKHFIQIADICRECKNFNSMLAIVSGLDHLSVTRLKETWEKVSSKYKKTLQELRVLLDTTKNFKLYRQLLKSESIQPPIIPFFPICQKDLFAIKELGGTTEEGLINFDKLRQFAKCVRSIVQMTSSSFDLLSLKDVPTSHSVIFSMFGCTNPSLVEYRSSGYQYQFTKLNIKQDHVKKLYEESVMVRKVRHYLNSIFKDIEKDEERLRAISSTLENTTSVNTLRRKPSPSNSLGGSVSSINGLNNSHNAHNISNRSSISTNKNSNALFGTHSPDAVKKLLSLSETKVKSVKGSVSSTSVPLSHLSNSRLLNASTSSNNSNLSSNNIKIESISPTTPLSPKTKNRSISSSQPLNKQNHSVPAQNGTSTNTSKHGKYSTADTYSNNPTSVLQTASVTPQSQVVIKSHAPVVHQPAHLTNIEGDSGRESMASNNEQEQSSPTFTQRNQLSRNKNSVNMDSSNSTISHSQYFQQSQEMNINQAKSSNGNFAHQYNKFRSEPLNPKINLDEEEDQVSAV